AEHHARCGGAKGYSPQRLGGCDPTGRDGWRTSRAPSEHCTLHEKGFGWGRGSHYTHTRRRPWTIPCREGRRHVGRVTRAARSVVMGRALFQDPRPRGRGDRGGQGRSGWGAGQACEAARRRRPAADPPRPVRVPGGGTGSVGAPRSSRNGGGALRRGRRGETAARAARRAVAGGAVAPLRGEGPADQAGAPRDRAAQGRVIAANARCAAVTPRYCASSNSDRPLRSELAKKMRCGDLVRRNRSCAARKPTVGRTMAWPSRKMSTRDTQRRMSGWARSRSARIASFQKRQSRWSSSPRFATGDPVHERVGPDVPPELLEQPPHDPAIALRPGEGPPLLLVARGEIVNARPRRGVLERCTVVVAAGVPHVPAQRGRREALVRQPL